MRPPPRSWKEAPGAAGEAPRVACDPRFIAFEFVTGFVLREDQANLVRKFARALGVSTPGGEVHGGVLRFADAPPTDMLAQPFSMGRNLLRVESRTASWYSIPRL